MEAAEADIEFKDGKFTRRRHRQVGGIGRGRASTAYVPHNYPLDELEPGLDETAFYDPPNFTYPGRHLHLRGRGRPRRPAWSRSCSFAAVDDFGNIINPMIVEGQVHGGLAQGIGQALLESAVYDESGQL